MATETAPNLARLLAAYRDAVDGFLGVAHAVETKDGAWDTATECPGWSVGDVVAHVVGLEQDLEGLPAPEHALPEGLDHVKSEGGRRMEVQVDLRRGLPPATVVGQLEQIVTVRLGTLNRQVRLALENHEDPEVAGPFGRPVPLSRLLQLRVFDVWVHEQDIRWALGAPGRLSCPAAEVFADQVMAALPYVVARKAGLRPGTIVQLWADGQTSLHATVLVGSDHRGRLVGRDAGLPTVDISMDWELLIRLACGRVSAEDALPDVALDGSRKAGIAVLANLNIAP